MALGLVLLASAIPFTAFGFGSAARAGTPPKPDEVVIELYGIVQGKRTVSFVFEEKTIQYKGGGSMNPNPPVRVNGVLWEDMNTPFQLNFTPDFENVSILEQSGHNFELFKGKNSFTVSIKNRDPSNDMRYRVRIAAKYQKKRENAQPKTIPAREIKNPPPLTTDGGTVMYGPMMISGINGSMDGYPDEPTDGKDQSTSRPVSAPIQENYQPQLTKIDLVATVDKLAGFRVQANYVLYQNYKTRVAEASGPGVIYKGGKYASNVTVNGKQWTNLNRPFNMQITPDPARLKKFSSKSDRCNISYSLHHGILEIIIENPDEAPAQVHIQLTFD